jgi:WD40 repeat protein
VVYSRAELEAEEQEREAARQRELAQAQALAEEQQQRAEEQAAASQRLRQRAVFLLGALIVAVIAIAAAGVFLYQSNQSEQKASQREAEARTAQANAETERANAVSQKSIAQAASRQAEAQTRLAQIGELAAQAQAAAKQFPQTSLLLAAESLMASRAGEAPVDAARKALYDTIAQVDGRTLDGGLTATIDTVILSMNRRRLVTLGNDGIARAWDLSAADPTATPYILRNVEGFFQDHLIVSELTGYSRSLSPDGRWLVSIGKHMRVWDLNAVDPAGTNTTAIDLPIPVSSFAWSDDSHWLAVLEPDDSVQIWDMASPKATPATQLPPLPVDGTATDIALSLHRRWLITRYSDSSIRLRDLNAADPNAETKSLRTSAGFQISPDGHWLLTGIFSIDESLKLWDLTAPDPTAHSISLAAADALKFVREVVFSPDGRRVAAWNNPEKAFWIWDLAAADVSTHIIRLPGTSSSAPTFSVDGRWVATASALGRTAQLWRLNDDGGPPTSISLPGHEGTIYVLLFTRDGNTLVTASADRTVRVWDLTSAQPAETSIVLHGQNGVVTFAGFDNAQRWLFTGGDGTVRLWSLDSVRARTVQRKVKRPAFSADGRRAAGFDEHDNLQIWSPLDFHIPIRTIPDRMDRSETPTLSANGRWLAAVTEEGSVEIWDLDASDLSAASTKLPEVENGYEPLSISADGSRIATSNRDGELQVWNRTGTTIAKRYDLTYDSSRFTLGSTVVMSSDGRVVVATGDENGEDLALVWDLTGQNPTAVAQTLANASRYLAFGSDGRLLITGLNDSLAAVWDLHAFYENSGPITLRATLSNQSATATAVAASSAATNLVATVNQLDGPGGGKPINQVRLWDLSSSSAPRSILLPTSDGEIMFSPDQMALITLGTSGQAHVWPLKLDDMIATACRSAGRNLSWSEWQEFFGAAPYHQTCRDLPPHPSYIKYLLSLADQQAREGKIDQASAALADAQRQSPNYVAGATYWNTLCWLGALSGHVKDVLDACGRAVALAPYNAKYRDSRGLARALTGDPTGAIEDFEAFIAWANEQDPESNQAAITQREHWIADLRAGRQPFDEETLRQLHEQEQ